LAPSLAFRQIDFLNLEVEAMPKRNRVIRFSLVTDASALALQPPKALEFIKAGKLAKPHNR
jgi:hypothetical protein